MNRKFNSGNHKFLLISILSFSVFILVFFLVLNNTNLNNFFVRNNLNEFNNNSIINIENINKKIVFSSLNKIVNYKDIEYVIDDFPVVKEEDDKEEEKDYNPKVYIYNSHQTEGYSMPFVSDYSITPTVVLASYILKDYLNDFGIDSYVEKRSIKSYLDKKNLCYYYCYDASRYYMMDAKKEYDFEYYIDLHRDSAKKKSTLYQDGKKKYARIMFVVGLNHASSSKNLKFVESINSIINKKYKGLSRGIYKRDDVRFNQDVSPHAILLELGGVDNTLEEINNTLEVFAEVLNEYMEASNGS